MKTLSSPRKSDFPFSLLRSTWEIWIIRLSSFHSAFTNSQHSPTGDPWGNFNPSPTPVGITFTWINHSWNQNINIISPSCISHNVYTVMPIHRKRTVSEVQLMHNRGEHKQEQERKLWLLSKLDMIHKAPDPKRSRPEELKSELTPVQIQAALDFLDEFLKSKKSWLRVLYFHLT